MRGRSGLVVGRFQPLHLGHVFLIETAFRENDEVVICIGSAQKADPLSMEERRERIVEKLNSLGYDMRLCRIVGLNDIGSDEKWPLYLKEECGITDEMENTFYTSEDLLEDYAKAMKDLGFQIKTVVRGSFNYEAPDGRYYTVSSATEIRGIHKRLGLEV